MSRIRRWNLGLVVSLLMTGTLVCGSAPALAVTKLSDEPQEFSTIKEPDRAYVYTDMRIGHGRVVALETTYTHERHTSDWQSVVSVQEYNRQELADFNALALKYPFLESLNRSISLTNFLAEKLKTVPADDAAKIEFLTASIMLNTDSLSQGQVLQKGFRVWSVDRPRESIFVPVVDRDADIVMSLGPTGLVWKEFKGGDNYPKTAKTVLYNYDFATKKIISHTLTSHTVAFESEYYSAVVVVDSDYYYWDIKNNALIKFSSLFKIPANYRQGGESQGSHYLGVNLSRVNSNTIDRILWVDTKTKKPFTIVYPKGVPHFGEWKVYGEFGYALKFDAKTGQTEVWQLSFKNKRFTQIFNGKVAVQTLSWREIDGRNLWFEGRRAADSAKSGSGVNIVLRFNADKKVMTEWETLSSVIPSVYKDGHWQQLSEKISDFDRSTSWYTYLAYTKGNIVMSALPKSVADYRYGDIDEANPRSIREIMLQLQAYRLSTSNLIIAKSSLPLLK